MTITVDATYENGSLRLAQPLPLKENERIRVIVQTGESWVHRTAGMIPWAGDPGELERLAMDPEFSPVERP